MVDVYYKILLNNVNYLKSEVSQCLPRFMDNIIHSAPCLWVSVRPGHNGLHTGQKHLGHLAGSDIGR